MDIRLEVLRINGVWSVTASGPDIKPFGSEASAIHAAIQTARAHHAQNGGKASVHLWYGAKETTIFDTSIDRQGSS